MNSIYNIQIRVITRQVKQQLAEVQAEVAKTSATVAAANKSMSGLGAGAAVNGLTAFGSKLQWAGRQLQYNFTLPIALAIGAAAKWELANEKATTNIAKVYGNIGITSQDLKANIDALGKSFEALSNRYGVQRSQVLDIAAAWAAAGYQGVQLAKSVDLTLQTMILGEMDQASATTALISIQSQYGLSTSQLADTIGQLNVVENQTAITMSGLIDGFQRAAGVARTAGVSTRELAALLAAMVPAAGSAANAGNALKTIFSRLIAPTAQAADIMAQMGINTKSLAWESANGTQKLQIMAAKFVELSSAQQGLVSSTVASRYQINRFDILMRELAPGAAGQFKTAMDATANSVDVYAQKQRELNQVLDSNPQKFKQIGVIIQNSFADVIQPLIPTILMLANGVRELAQWFANISPPTQRLIGLLLILLAAVGPVARYIGAVQVLFGLFGKAILALETPIKGLYGWLRTLVTVSFTALTTGISMIGSAAWAAVSGVIALAVNIGRFLVAQVAASIAMFARWATLVGAWLVETAAATVVAGVRMAAGFAIGAAGALELEGAVAVAGAEVVTFGKTMLLFPAVAIRSLFANLGKFILGIFAFIFNPAQLIAKVGLFLGTLVGEVAAVIGAIAGGPVLIIAGILAAIGLLFFAFRDKIGQFVKGVQDYFASLPGGITQAFAPITSFFEKAIDFIIRAFYSLPQAIQNAMISVVQVVASAAKQVYQLFSYLNPFAKHSPSLVENSEKGMKAVGDHHQNAAAAIQTHAKTAYQATQAVGDVSAGLTKVTDSSGVTYAKQATGSSAVGSSAGNSDKSVSALNSAIKAGTVILDMWQIAIDKVNIKLLVQQQKLDDLKKIQDAYSNSLSTAKDRLNTFANTPIEGMKKMSDAIFNANMQQKALQLQLMKMEDAGGTIDDIHNKMSNLQGQIELLTGQSKDLRAAGAGSDVLAGIDSQVAGLEAQRKSAAASAKPLEDLQKQIDAVGRSASELDLENSLKFDPLTKQINDAANAMKELPFDQILAGTKAAAAQVAFYTDKYNAATAAVNAQQVAVDALQASKDKLSKSYDLENAQLQLLKDQLQSYTDKAAAASKGGAGASAIDKNFAAAAGANIPSVGGTGGIKSVGSIGDINAFTAEIAKQTAASLGNFDLFGPIKDQWNKVTGWFGKNIQPAISAVWGGLKAGFAAMDFGSIGATISGGFSKAIDIARGPWEGFVRWLGIIWQGISAPIIDIAKRLWQGVKDVAQPIIDEFKSWGDVFEPLKGVFDNLMKVVQGLWMVLKPILGALGLAFMFLGEIVFHVLANVIGPVFSIIGQVIGGALRIIHGAILIITGLLSGNWSALWQGVLDIVTGTWEAIWGVISNAGKILWGIVSGIVQGIVSFFNWLKDVVVGHSIIPDMVNAVIQWFQFMWNIIKGIWDVFMAVIHVVADVVMWFYNSVVAPVMSLIVKAFQFAWSFIKLYLDAEMALFRALWGVLSVVLGWIRGGWDALVGFLGGVWTRIQGIIGGIGRVFSGLADTAKTVWSNVTGWFNNIVNFIIGLPSKIASAAKGMWDGITGAFKSAINWIIQKWNDLSLTVGGQDINVGPIHYTLPTITLNTPNIPYLAQGGLTRGLSIAGEGRMPEYVIPTDPAFRAQAQALWAAAGATLGLAQFTATDGLKGAIAAGGSALRGRSVPGAATVTYHDSSTTHVNIGHLEFPNVKSGADAEDFVKNLLTVTRS